MIFFAILPNKIIKHRSIHSELFCKKTVLKNFAKFTGKHLRRSLFFNKVEVLQRETLLKKKLRD